MVKLNIFRGFEVISNRLLCLALVFMVLAVGCRKKPKEIETQLHRAARTGDLEVVRSLIETGLDVNAKDEYGRTPLHYAAFGDYKEVVEFLINKGANISALDNYGDTPLHNAAFGGSEDVVKFLIEKGCDIRCTNNRGWVPLHRAAYNGHTAVVLLLISEGSDPNIRTKDGRMAKDFAWDSGFADIVKIFDNDANEMSLSVNKPYIIIVSDRQSVQQYLESQFYDFDDIWIPGEKDIEGLNEILKVYLKNNTDFNASEKFSREIVLAYFR